MVKNEVKLMAEKMVQVLDAAELDQVSGGIIKDEVTDLIGGTCTECGDVDC